MAWEPQELDRLVARALPELGATWMVTSEVTVGERTEGILESGTYATEREALARARELGPGWTVRPAFRPSEDPGDALRVLDALVHRADVHQVRLTWDRGLGWEVCFQGARRGCIHSPSLCQAVCQGALFVAGVADGAS